MKTRSLAQLVARDLQRTRGALATAGFGIVMGTAALTFFVSLGLGARQALLSELFPLDKIELEPTSQGEPGLLALVIGETPNPRISAKTVEIISRMPQVKHLYPKLRFGFPCSARGGKDIVGHDISVGEMIGEGIDPKLVRADVRPSWKFEDPWKSAANPCNSDADCDPPEYCETPNAGAGKCTEPVPALVSRYLVEVFNKGIAPAHGLPSVGETLIETASGVTFSMRLGQSLLGTSSTGTPRTIRARIVGVSPRAIDLGLTLPLETVQRWNEELANNSEKGAFSSLLVQTRTTADAAIVIDHARSLGLSPKDTRARDVSVLVNVLTALLSLVSLAILLMAAATIAYTFRALLRERASEIAVCRTVGATTGDIVIWHVSLAATIGFLYAVAGVFVAWLITLGVDWLAATRLPDFPFKPTSFFAWTWWLPISTALFGMLFAVLGAYKPAKNAAKRQPRDALMM